MSIKFKAQMMGMSPRLIEKTDPRRLQELMDARLIQEDEHAMANCPTRAINEQFHHSYVNPYSDHSLVHPIPARNRKYSDSEDKFHNEADRESDSYGQKVVSEW
jgi:hypothetical protein